MERKNRCKNWPRGGPSKLSSVLVSSSRKDSSADHRGGLGSPGFGIKIPVQTQNYPNAGRAPRYCTRNSVHENCQHSGANRENVPTPYSTDSKLVTVVVIYRIASTDRNRGKECKV